MIWLALLFPKIIWRVPQPSSTYLRVELKQRIWNNDGLEFNLGCARARDLSNSAQPRSKMQTKVI